MLLKPPGSAMFTMVSIRGGAPRVIEDAARLSSQVPRNGSSWAVRPAGTPKAARIISTIGTFRDIATSGRLHVSVSQSSMRRHTLAACIAADVRADRSQVTGYAETIYFDV